MIRRLAVMPIVLYQWTVSPWLRQRCRYYPSCSQYAKEAMLKYGPLRGVALAAQRIVRCNPWNPGGIDFVP